MKERKGKGNKKSWLRRGRKERGITKDEEKRRREENRNEKGVRVQRGKIKGREREGKGKVKLMEGVEEEFGEKKGSEREERDWEEKRERKPERRGGI
jgi:hypothetical protein